jgi:ribosomal protein RSM22 (predicted rRNA methylase)
VVTKKHTKAVFTAARKAFWGDLFFLDRVKTTTTQPQQPKKYFPTTRKRSKELRKLVKAKKRLMKLSKLKSRTKTEKLN